MPPAAEPQGRLVLVRHGETEWSRTGRHTGRTDVPLTPAGERDARRLRARLDEFDLAVVRSSPLVRARRTAELAGFDPVADDDLVEWDYGAHEGRTTAQIREELGDPGWRVIADGVVPGETPGETIEEVAARTSRVLERVAGPLETRDVALFAHGHLLRVLAATYLRREPRFAAHLLLDAGGLCVLEHEHGVPAIRSWNDTGR
ncbi:histidine phosphatase family protein [Fodinibacter luteus]